jgi:hypothetical protein
MDKQKSSENSPNSVIPSKPPMSPPPLSPPPLSDLAPPGIDAGYDSDDSDDQYSILNQRRDIFHPDLELIKDLYNSTPERKRDIESGELNALMDKNDKERFLHELATHYYTDGFFATQRVAALGFTKDEIDRIAKSLEPWTHIPDKSDNEPGKFITPNYDHRKFRPPGLSRKGTPIGGKKRRPTKRRPTKRRPTKRKRQTKKRRQTKRRPTKRKIK